MTFDAGPISASIDSIARSLSKQAHSSSFPRSVSRRNTEPVQAHEDSPRALARAAGLRYVVDSDSGLTRRRFRGRFIYMRPDGSRLEDEDEIKRINSLAIPPAYEHVWICNDPKGHIQATARDARGRKQYRYHSRWQEVSAATKFERMLAFGEMLPRIRRKVSRALRVQGMPREKVLAAVVQLLDITLIRVGNDEYARQNSSYGLTTLLTRHVRVAGTKMTFDFRGKSGVDHRLELRHWSLAAFMKSCLQIPGRELFQYLDDKGRRHAVTSGDVNAYLQSIGGPSISAKDFRTWGGSALALRDLRTRTFASAAEAKRQTRNMYKAVAERLGNTATVCRKSYIHPLVVECFLEARLSSLDAAAKMRGLRQHEAEFLSLLRIAGCTRITKSRKRTAATAVH